MIEMRQFAGLSVLLSGLMLAGCGAQKGDLGAEVQDKHFATPDAEPKLEVAVQSPADQLYAAASTSKPVDVTAADGPIPVAPPAAPVADGEGGEVVPTPPNPTPAPAPVSPEALVQERLNQEAVRKIAADRQGRTATAQAAFDTAMKLYNDMQYEESVKYFERAVKLDSTNRLAVQKLSQVRALLGVHTDRLAETMRSLEQQERVKIQEALVVLANALEEGRVYEAKASTTPIEIADEEKEKILAEQLENLRQAQARYRRVKEIMNYMPPQIDLPGERRVVEEALARVRQKIEEKSDAISFQRRLIAQRLAEKQGERETEVFRSRIAKMNEQVKDLFNSGDFKAAEHLAMKVMQLDAFNKEADGWKRRARAAYHTSERREIDRAYPEAEKSTWEEVDTAHIPYDQLVTYPTNWDVISRRPDRSAIGGSKVEEEWKKDIRKKLQRKVTFEFVDTPLEEAVTFLRSMTNVTMIVDPKVVQGGPLPISLRVSDMSLDLALEWLLRLADLDYALKDNAIYISKKQTLVEDVDFRIYDVSDLTQAIPDFPGPDIQLSTPGDDQGGAGGNPFQGAPPPAVTVQSIADMIRNRVKPDSWDPNLGTSIEERAGKLVVMQRPEIHGLIDQLLSNFRATQKIMVCVESRFLVVREAYLEEIGVEFNGLDVNVLNGDFGDIRQALGGLNQPRQTAAAGTPGPGQGNVPFPGFVDGPNPLLGGVVSTVGAIVNHAVNFFPTNLDNALSTISALDTTGQVRQGGLSAQFSFLGKAQLQAFIRALGVRENTTTLFAPRLTVFNTQRAHMFVARQRTYVSDYDISGDAYDPVIRQFMTGAVLDVRPTVSSDRRYVTMEMRPTVTEGKLSERSIQSYTVLSGATATILIPLTLPIEFPELTIRRVRSTGTVPDGGILLIGGLQRNVKFHSETGVPVLSDLPVVGRLFRWNSVDNVRSSLAILISPKIILFNEEEGR